MFAASLRTNPSALGRCLELNGFGSRCGGCGIFRIRGGFRLSWLQLALKLFILFGFLGQIPLPLFERVICFRHFSILVPEQPSLEWLENGPHNQKRK